MRVDDWFRMAVEDAERRGLPGLRPLLEGLARSTSALRAADWNDRVAPRTVGTQPQPDPRP